MKEVFQNRIEKLYPVRSLEEEKKIVVDELKARGFVITKYEHGGIFNMILMILLQIKRELLLFAQKMQLNSFLTSAESDALDLKATDFSKIRREATKTKGKIVLTRSQADETVVIEAGLVFKTEQDGKGEELRYFSTEKTIFERGKSRIKVKIEAEMPGEKYNVEAAAIKSSIAHIETIETINNETDWIDYPGTDVETEEEFRERVKGSWEELAALPTSGKYKIIAESVPGILYALVKDLHPRGQGTIDILVAGTLGKATEAQLEAVREVSTAIKSPYDDILVKSIETETQNVRIEIIIDKGIDKEEIEKKAKEHIRELLKIRKQKNMQELYKADIIYSVKSNLLNIKNIKIIEPAEDIILQDKIIVPGEITIEIKEV